MLNWHIGQQIVEFEQEGIDRAKYGTELITKLTKDLLGLHGKGFSVSNLKRMKQFYLGWSYYVELLKRDDPLERSFYHQQGVNMHLLVKVGKNHFWRNTHPEYPHQDYHGYPSKVIRRQKDLLGGV